MYYDWIQTNKRTIIILVAIMFAAITAWGVFTYISRAGKVGITISAVPSDATVTINGEDIGNGTHWVAAGTYEIAARKDGYKTRTKQVDASFDKQQNVVALSLPPESDMAKKWAEAHPEAYKSNEEYGAIEARANGEFFRSKYPITNVLPVVDPYYEIGYTSTNSQDITITISTASPRYRYLAIERFRSLGYNPTDYKINFVDFKSPLEVANE